MRYTCNLKGIDSSTNPAKLVMIGSVDVEIFVPTEIVKNKIKIKITK